MIIRKLTIQNFRGVREANLTFTRHALLVGPNNVGKSTVLEALDLLLGPNRTNRADALDEHDFFESRYLKVGDEPRPEIVIEGVLTDLSEDAQRVFRSHLEWWDENTSRLLTAQELRGSTPDQSSPAVRVRFRGWYDQEEDQFRTRSEFCHPVPLGEDEATAFTRAHKQHCGFVYLRTLRTGNRALSLEPGSLLDLILELKEVKTGELWERMITQVKQIGDSAASDPELGGVLKEIETRIAQFVRLPSSGEPVTKLHVTDHTRRELREVVAFFLRTNPSGTSVPFQHAGTGTLNVLVLALLTFIAELKKDGAIFAMEEPEMALPPYTQRRIVSTLMRDGSQCLLTSHSPYVAEAFVPDHLIVLARDRGKRLIGTQVHAIPEVKQKTLMREFRNRFAEGLLSPAVLLVEGVTERTSFPATADVLLRTGGTDHLDALGVTVIEVGGEGNLDKFGKFFRELGGRVYGFRDKPNKPAPPPGGTSPFHVEETSPYTGMEKLLTEEIPVQVLQSFVEQMRGNADFPKHLPPPTDSGADATRDYVCRVLKACKGEGYAAELVRLCTPDSLPNTVVTFLRTIQADMGANG